MTGSVLENKSIDQPHSGRHAAAQPVRQFGEKLSTLDGLLRHGKIGQGGKSSKGPGHNSEGGMFQQLLGVDDHSGEHSVLSRLLGLDREAHLPSARKSAGDEQGGSHMPIWVSALQHAKFSHLFEGVHITANMGFGLLFAFLISWLFLLYFIRHHEPFAASVLGKSAAQESKSAIDRQVINGSHIAMPYPTKPDDTFFVPSPGAPVLQSAPLNQANAVVPVPLNAPSAQWVPSATVPQTNNQPLVIPNNAGYAAPMTAAPVGAAMNMPESSASGERLKTFVSR